MSHIGLRNKFIFVIFAFLPKYTVAKHKRGGQMSLGYLSITTRIANDASAVPGVKIYILPSGASMSDGYTSSAVSDTYYSYYLTTDSSGNTGFLPIDAPDTSISENPASTAIPYTSVDVYAAKEGFYPVRVRGVQVFGNTQSILPINLIPITSEFSGSSGGVLDFTIPKNQLLSPGSHNMQGPGASQTEPLISEDIYIPETVTVHLGTPSSNARNVTVPFTEYIKNVASSEIYPNWSEEALKANIYAIISLTLNRIFTEWYPSQGYNFDITSTTSYDQSFVPERNIYENISRLVDENFNTYVTRQGYVNPLFTTFCDGRTVSCNGLSQWGSEELARQGKDALQILKYYYGDDISLTSTDDIRSAESSYPGTPLRLGSTGSDVLRLQGYLTRIRENYPAIPVIPTLDGQFGFSTDAAVRAFQEIFDLASDGIVGKSTWYRISYVYSSVRKLAEVIGEGESDIFSEEVPSVTVSLGDSGDYVLLLQKLLNYIAVFYPTVASVSEDSIFGQLTANAVRSFQNTFGLSTTGVVTPAVWDAMYKVYIEIINSVTPSLPNQGFPGYDLKRGDRGEAVRLMQTYLNAISRQRYPNIPTVSEDGDFGGNTENAVIAFQQSTGLNPTGVIDVTTWERIAELYNFGLIR